jgi:phage tail-like protein
MTTMTMQPGWLADQLPRRLADDPLTRQVMRIFEDIGQSVRLPVLSFAHNLDAGLAPMEFVRWMGQWLALSVPASLSEQRQRDLLATVGATWKLRGTKGSLARLLATVTGDTADVDDGGGVFGEGEAPPNQKKVVVDLATRGEMTDEQIIDFIRLEVPANVSIDLRVGGEAAGQVRAPAAGAEEASPEESPPEATPPEPSS